MGGICSSMGADIGFSAGEAGTEDTGRRRALDVFQVDKNFKRVVYKKVLLCRPRSFFDLHKQLALTCHADSS